MIPAAAEPGPDEVPAETSFERVRTSGKFFLTGGRKFYVKGVSYGPFRPDEDGAPFPPDANLRHDFRERSTPGRSGCRRAAAE